MHKEVLNFGSDPKVIILTFAFILFLHWQCVSSAENKNNLDSQAERLCNYSIAKGYQVVHVVNGSYNILVKAFPNAFGIGDREVLVTPLVGKSRRSCIQNGDSLLDKN
jgi:hypothetical protein